MDFKFQQLFYKRTKIKTKFILPCDIERGAILNFLKNIFNGRFYKTSSIEELTKYNKIFEGCSLINFDELPTENDYKGMIY